MAQMTPEERSELARKAVQTRWAREKVKKKPDDQDLTTGHQTRRGRVKREQDK